jgi:hypothetical protein
MLSVWHSREVLSISPFEDRVDAGGGAGGGVVVVRLAYSILTNT